MSENFLENKQLTFTSLSPVHIGCGQDYEMTNYIINKERLYSFTDEALAQLFTDKDRENLLKQLNQKDPILAVRRYIRDLGPRAMAISNNKIMLPEKIADEISGRTGIAANTESDGNKVIAHNAIARCVFNGLTQETILPGSSIKGAIRTAIVSGENKRKIQPEKRNKHENRDINSEIQHAALGSKPYQTETDPFRPVKIADAIVNHHDKRLDNTVAFEINKKKRPNKKGGDGRGNVKNYVEVINSFNPLSFKGELSIHKSINHDKSPSLILTADNLITACNQFYQKRFIDDMEIMQRLKLAPQSWIDNINSILTKCQPLFNKQRAFLLRVGRHSGAESVTIDGARSIKIMGGKGKPDSYKDHATTIWLAADKKRAATGLPFGWLLVFVDDAINEPVARQIHQFMDELNQSKLEKQQQLLQDERKAAVEALHLKQKQAEKEAIAAKEAEKEAKRLQQLENMPAEEKEIYILLEFSRIEENANRLKPGCEVIDKLNHLIQTAVADWDNNNKMRLHQAAIEIYKAIYGDKYKKNKKVKAKLASLKGNNQ